MRFPDSPRQRSHRGRDPGRAPTGGQRPQDGPLTLAESRPGTTLPVPNLPSLNGSGQGSGQGSDSRLSELTRHLAVQARAAGQRLTLALSGDRDWTATAAQAAAAAYETADTGPVIWLSERPIHPRAHPLEGASRLLGGECALLVYDAWSGFDPDGFGAATGSLTGGGLLILLCPPLADWPSLPEPQVGRITPWPLPANRPGGRFIERLVRVLQQAPGVSILEQGAEEIHGLPPLPAAPDDPPPPLIRDPGIRDPAQAATPDQARAIAAILHHASGRPHRPLVLTAHRGRGKSAALGIAAAHLMAAPGAPSGPRRCLVTAPRRAACDALFQHAARAWPGAHVEGSGLSDGAGTITFLAPDALCQDHPHADLLLVDEAAGIPAPLLAELLGRYPRVIFATTVHGYEGTGRGFEVRFRETLNRQTPHWQALTLETPIRWTAGDPLEALVFRALLLDASPLPPELPRASTPIESLDQETLADDDATLRQVFGLLVLAHYQTRPMDLRMLLDGPGVRVLILRERGVVAATLIAVEEGGLGDPDLQLAIFEGRRRPRGHLLPLTLSAHGGLADAPRLRYLRVIRIAVHPALTRHGLGRRLLRGLFRVARRDGIDLLGTSFGAVPGLVGFWSAAGYRPVQLGTSRNAASGEHALVMLRPASRSGWRFTNTAAWRFARRLPDLLAGPLRDLDPGVAATVLRVLGRPLGSSGPEAELRPDETAELQSFATGHRTLEAALPALARLSRQLAGQGARAQTLGPAEAALLVATAMQFRPAAALTERFGFGGRAEWLAALRALVGRLPL